MSLTPFQQDVARVVLEAISDLGFALGGGQALHVHGYGDRPSMDLDFYQTRFDTGLFDKAETAALAALHSVGYEAVVAYSDSWLRQLVVTSLAANEQVALDLGQDYRADPPVVVAGIGPVLSLTDAAASKARALNDRRAARDYLDIHALLDADQWTPAALYTILLRLRPTLTAAEFADDLAAAGDQDPDEYTAYGLDHDAITRLTTAFTAWANQLRSQRWHIQKPL